MDCVITDTAILNVGIFHNTLGITLKRYIIFAPITEQSCTNDANANKTSFMGVHLIMITCLSYSCKNKYFHKHTLSIHSGNKESNNTLVIAVITQMFFLVFI